MYNRCNGGISISCSCKSGVLQKKGGYWFYFQIRKCLKNKFTIFTSVFLYGIIDTTIEKGGRAVIAPIDSDESEMLTQEGVSHVYEYADTCICDGATCQSLPSYEYIEIATVTEGNGVHCIDGKALPCKSGDIFVVPPKIPHGFFAVEGGERMLIRCVRFFVEDWFKGENATPKNKRYCYGVFGDGDSFACAVLSSRMKEKINYVMDCIENELADREEDRKTLIKTYLVQLCSFIGRYVNSSLKYPQRQSRDAETASLVIKIIEKEFTDNTLSLETIASRVFVSPSNLSRVFKAQSGQLFSEYLRDIRLTHAAALIRESEHTVEKIVSMCGFKDISSFYRNFRETFGMTPQIYKQIEKEANEKQKINNNTGKETRKMELLREISQNVQIGKAKIVKELVQKAIDEGANVEEILNEGLLSGMSIIGEKFKNNEIYVPEVLVAARAMSMGAQILKPLLTASGVKATGKVCIGTVQGDLHDIGKNLVKMMMEGKGLEVVDLGTDVAPETFVKTAIEENCQIICCSALLTTTMSVMGDVVKAAEEAGIRDKVKIMIGGAPINEEFRQKIGADCYTVDAASAADAAVAFCKE